MAMMLGSRRWPQGVQVAMEGTMMVARGVEIGDCGYCLGKT